jgi:hypothetical protein
MLFETAKFFIEGEELQLLACGFCQNQAVMRATAPQIFPAPSE